ncbi:MAG: hypothetical protein IJU37_10675 [Desulfovibrio sp.]|nr:hypothetical protein [Desulfovibrio sp.]
MATASTSGLVENTDFSADLLLNKIMNGQYRTNNGNTITMGGRINAAHLDVASRVNNADAANAAKAVTIVDGVQNALTEVLAVAKNAYEAAKTINDTTAMSRIGTEFSNELSKLLDTKLDGIQVLKSQTAINLGAGSGSISAGIDLSSEGAYVSLTKAVSSMAAGTTGNAGYSVIETAINDLLGLVSVAGAQASLLNNRYDMLNDLSQSYHTASDHQVVTQGGNSTSLLNALL